MINKLLNKLEAFLYSLVDDNDGLKEELDTIGVRGVLAIAVAISVMCSLCIYMWVAI